MMGESGTMGQMGNNGTKRKWWDKGEAMGKR